MTIEVLSINTSTVEGFTSRYAEIIISDGQTAYLWGVGGLPLEGDVQALLEAREAELWQAAQVGGRQISPEQLAREVETRDASLTAIEYFKASPAAVDFVRLTPAEQATAIDAMTTTQLKNVIKYLTVAVSAAIRREYL